ncbi:5-formyltetrahydrofolate cyclo-ligase [Helicobacter suis]|uniref:5-formyltetrahydrofolate cyclo-ligase n=1 Tax=Helicobacter suis TaxID=104628 RepID=UPI001F07A6A5|nr:5-formyltetrahydrofolate cyclo-ligase [Helicobacter suis]
MQFRTTCKGILYAKHSDIKDHKIITHLIKAIKPYARLNVLIYCAMPHEVSLMPFIKWARRQKINLFMPFVRNQSCLVVPYRLPLIKNAYGIYESKFSLFYKTNLDLAIIPVLGIDPHFKRVGFGKGMYDCLFARFKKPPLSVFIAKEILVSTLALGESHDIKGDYCMDYEGIYHHSFKRKLNGKNFYKQLATLLTHRH